MRWLDQRPAFALLALVALGTPAALAFKGNDGGNQEMRFFRIATGSAGGVYFPLGGKLASVISSPPGSLACERGGRCGVAGLVAVAHQTKGSTENAALIDSGAMESGLVQADIAFAATHGERSFAGRPLSNLRAIASLFPEAIHVAVRADSTIYDIKGLRGRRVAIGPLGSGTHDDSLLVLAAYGLGSTDLDMRPVRVDDAIGDMRAGTLDAVFFLGGFPAAAMRQLAEATPIRLLPLAGPAADALIRDKPFFKQAVIPGTIYKGVLDTVTLAVDALWLVNADVPEDLVHGVTRALWHESAQALLASGGQVGRKLSLERALDGLIVPLHPGAVRYYRERGIIGD
ncbi:MAG: TAXI family TRAP transporter solute-binding subunit [Alphaproteobacteria bacterium]|nr:TAXI family TRAP transporter solute-binding subunit [Alphaproteobacteria bacterium]